MKRDLKGRYHKWFRAHPAAILQHGGRQDATRHLSHLISHAELKLLDERVGLVICTPHLRAKNIIFLFNRKKAQKEQALCRFISGPQDTHQPADLLLSVWCRAGCCFDHGRRLVVC